MIDKQVLGGDWEGTKPVRAQEKQHGVWEGVEWEVGPVLRGGPRLEPWEGQTTARVICAQGSVVWRVAMERRSLHGGGESGGSGVNLQRGAQNPEMSQSAFIREEKFERREAGLDGQDAGGGVHEAVCCPPLDLVPEHGEFSCHVSRGQEYVPAIAQDGEEEGGGQSVAEEWGEAEARRRETFDRHEGRLGLV